MSGYEHHFGPRPQTDAQAANSAAPDTDRTPLWNDPGYDAYLFAVDAGYRIDWYFEHGDIEAALEEEEAQREQERENIETDEDAQNFIANYGYDEEEWDDEDDDPDYDYHDGAKKHEPGCPGGINCRCGY